MTRPGRFGVLVGAALVVGCAGIAPPPDMAAPPTRDEIRNLGGDAYDEYFLTRWRHCTQFASTSTCRNQIYGGDGGLE